MSPQESATSLATHQPLDIRFLDFLGQFVAQIAFCFRALLSTDVERVIVAHWINLASVIHNTGTTPEKVTVIRILRIGSSHP
jgi:hypothetical protein